jgi:hypothetical protein
MTKKHDNKAAGSDVIPNAELVGRLEKANHKGHEGSTKAACSGPSCDLCVLCGLLFFSEQNERPVWKTVVLPFLLLLESLSKAPICVSRFADR